MEAPQCSRLTPRSRSAPRALVAATLAFLPFASSGCATVALWDELPQRRSSGGVAWCHGRTVSAVALTPVALAVDATLIGAWLWLECGCGELEIDFD